MIVLSYGRWKRFHRKRKFYHKNMAFFSFYFSLSVTVVDKIIIIIILIPQRLSVPRAMIIILLSNMNQSNYKDVKPPRSHQPMFDLRFANVRYSCLTYWFYCHKSRLPNGVFFHRLNTDYQKGKV